MKRKQKNPEEGTKSKKLLKKLKNASIGEQVQLLKQAMGHVGFDRVPRMYLDTGSKYLNRVYGSEEKGIAYGKVIVIAGKPSGGKSLLAALLEGLAQQDGATPAWVDVEDSFDAPWVKIHGLNPGKRLAPGVYSKLALFKPEFGEFTRSKHSKKVGASGLRLETAEELFDRAEEWMKLQRRLNPTGKICMVVDSTTAVQPEEEMSAGMAEQNMRTRQLAPFLNLLAKRWTGLAPNVNAIIIFVSQLRTNPGQMFGNPDYIPGGKGILFFPHCITIVKRAKGGVLTKNGKVVGLTSTIKNIKNKTGGGSVEQLSCGFQAQFNEYDWKFMSAGRAKALAKKQSKVDPDAD